MSFIDTFFENLKSSPSRPFVTEVHGPRLVRMHGATMRQEIARARGTSRARGVTPGDRVVLLAPNSARWVAADLALLAEGAIVVPMYARQEPTELAAMMADAGASLVICADEALASKMLAAEVRAIFDGAPVITFAELFDGEPVQEPPRPRADDDVVTIIYTSGTSGEPKGVMTTAGNVRFMLETIDGRLTELMGRPGGSDRVFHYLPFCFAGSRFVLWSCLFRDNGVMVSTDLNNLPVELKAAAPEWFLNVPALLERVKAGVETKVRGQGAAIRAMYDASCAAWAASRKGEATLGQRLLLAAARRTLFPKIKAQIGVELQCLICGSAPLSGETQAWFELLGLPVYQVYGLTETTAIVSMDRPRAADPGHVGYAIDGCEMKLGADDELLVRGPNVFAGYWGREAASQGAMLDGWFRTGDQARLEPDGKLAIVGRVKNVLVPESGHNVAPEPIEQRLLAGVEGVTQAVVIGHARPYLTAILTGAVEREAAARAIDAINTELPHYRRIRSFHLCAEPFTIESGLLTANQKLRRQVIERHFADAIEGLYA